DDQVKVGGYRIELDEIAWHLRQHPQVDQVCVETVGARRGASQLAAFVTLRAAPSGVAKAGDVLVDRTERAAFRLRQGWRPHGDGAALPEGPPMPSAWPRKSYRRFDGEQLRLADLAAVLCAPRPAVREDVPLSDIERLAG